MVLTQQGDSTLKYFYNVVSIPLWFLRNVYRGTAQFFAQYSFPYHYGSYATFVSEEYPWMLGNMFPYHYGSYATNKLEHRKDPYYQVSIPLWFLRN